MRRSYAVVAILTVATGPALADPTEPEIELYQLIAYDANPPPKFAFSNGSFYVGINVRRPSIGTGQLGETAVLSKAVTATSADGSAAWVAGNFTVGCDKAAGDQCTPDYGTPLHATGLLIKAGKEWQWVAWHVTETTTAKEQADLVSKGVMPAALTRSVTGAEDVAKVFETSFADPKALVASVSARKDVVLYGSSLAERVVGGAKVKAKLKGWNLSFKPRDGIQAGMAGKTVAWVAANMDAVSKRKGAKPSPYRVLAIYEKTSDWKLVQVHFSVDRD
jgi:hypothetical protein